MPRDSSAHLAVAMPSNQEISATHRLAGQPAGGGKGHGSGRWPELVEAAAEPKAARAGLAAPELWPWRLGEAPPRLGAGLRLRSTASHCWEHLRFSQAACFQLKHTWHTCARSFLHRPLQLLGAAVHFLQISLP